MFPTRSQKIAELGKRAYLAESLMENDHCNDQCDFDDSGKDRYYIPDEEEYSSTDCEERPSKVIKKRKINNVKKSLFNNTDISADVPVEKVSNSDVSKAVFSNCTSKTEIATVIVHDTSKSKNKFVTTENEIGVSEEISITTNNKNNKQTKEKEMTQILEEVPLTLEEQGDKSLLVVEANNVNTESQPISSNVVRKRDRSEEDIVKVIERGTLELKVKLSTTENEKIIPEKISPILINENNKEIKEIKVTDILEEVHMTLEGQGDESLPVEEINSVSTEPRHVLTNAVRKRARSEDEKKFKAKAKHQFIEEVCECKTKGCVNKFDTDERRKMYEQFWNMNKEEQKIWLSSKVTEVSAKRKVEGSKRNYTRRYHFDKENNKAEVCQKFFLNTLGYKSTTMLQFLSKASRDDHDTKMIIPRKDQRGRHAPSNKISSTPIKEHIKSFNPKPYRRSHAPNRKYLPPDLTIKYMHEDFKENHQLNVSYEKYRTVVDSLNIGFYDLEADKCGFCIEMDMNPSDENIRLKEEHLEEVKMVRSLYRADADLAAQLSFLKVYAADLQKVFLLPRMPKVKDSFFTSRLVVFNETFGALGSKDEHFCVVWHEATAGRRAEDIASAFLKFLDHLRDIYHIILWLDNCSGQNKNNILFSALITYLNSNLATTKSITLKYLISGHTYRAADGLHGKTEQVVRKKGNVEDFKDFKDCCKKASSRMNVIEMKYTDFFKLENKLKSFNRKKKSSEGDSQLPYFKDIVAVKVVRGSSSLYVKTNFNDVDYACFDNILKKQVNLVFPQPIQIPRGISSEKKETIVTKLVPKMQESRRFFWHNLPENTNAEDLFTEGF